MYSLRVIKDERPDGFLEYVIEGPRSESNIIGKTKADDSEFEKKVNTSLERLNKGLSSNWGNRSRAAAAASGQKAIRASLQTRRLKKVL